MCHERSPSQYAGVINLTSSHCPDLRSASSTIETAVAVGRCNGDATKIGVLACGLVAETMNSLSESLL
jgi:hypothetical protein